VARGTQHRKRRPAANARAAQVVAEKPKGKVKHPSWEDDLFFNRLRRHAKWVYVLLILVFALGFVLLGVGSGSSGIGDILQNFFQRDSASGPSMSSLEKRVQEHPKDPAAWRALATRLEQDQKTEESIDALTRLTALKPKDEDALQELAGLYSRRADDFRNEATAAQNESALVAPGALFQPAATTQFGKLFNDPNALQDPISNAASTQANAKVSDAYSKLAAVETKAVAVLKRLIALNPEDATRQLQLGQAAQNAGDTKTAVAAYQRFLKLAPDDPVAPAVKEQLKSLASSTAPPTAAG
jgi:regulator of sirC expression with transglutaminase-like and TPR domain